MIVYDENWVVVYEVKCNWMVENSLYCMDDEYVFCGVGFVVLIDGKLLCKVVDNGINVLKVIWYCGVVDVDGKIGDGVGIYVQIFVEFFYDQVCCIGYEFVIDKLIVVGQMFLLCIDFGVQECCWIIVEIEVLCMGYYIYGWCYVLVSIECLGEKVNVICFEIEQILICCEKDID